MPEASVNLDGSEERNCNGPDLFGFYVREITYLLTQDDELFGSSSRTGETSNVSSRVPENGRGTDSSSHISSLFSCCLEDAIPDVKRELLKASMRQSVKSLTQEVDEMIDPVMRIRHLFSCLRSKKQQSEGDALPDSDSPSPPCKKLKTSSSNEASELFGAQNRDAKDEREVDEYMKHLLEDEDTAQLELTITKHSNELEMMLVHMEQKLEELIDTVVSKCRLMTQQEKQQLAKLIQNLPPKNLDRVVEIIQGGKFSDSPSREIFVDLEKQANVTLWRLYFYVKAVENARKLSAQ